MAFKILETVIVIAVCMLSSIPCVQMFQSQRYQLKRYSKALTTNLGTVIGKNVFISLATTCVAWYLPIILAIFIQVEKTRAVITGWVVLLCFLVVGGGRGLKETLDLRDKFRMTMRVKRLMVTHGVLYTLLAVLFVLVHIPIWFLYVTVPFVTYLAGSIMKPIEDKINRGFYLQAKRKIRAQKGLITIGITGSAGKTQTKFILKGILEAKYNVLVTPASYNTVMGVSQTINDMLTREHNVFIAEMGAQYKGDIRTLTNLVHPKYGVITSIGQQHIDTLGSVDKVITAKEELIHGLPEDGAAFFAADNGYVERMYNRCEKEKYRTGVEQKGRFYLHAEEVIYTTSGTTFYLCTQDGKRVLCTTKLLGRYNVQDIVLAAAVALRMGMTLMEIVEAIEHIEPLPHKLQIMEDEIACCIDDKGNRSRDGVADALNTLVAMPNRRIAVTSGFSFGVERTDDVDLEYGKQLQDSADLLILVGDKEDLKEIVRGAHQSGMSPKAIKICKDFESAQVVLAKIQKKTDVILYEGEFEE